MSNDKNLSSTPARRRIEVAASLLFYRQGYNQTGINQILGEANSHKASLYRHFGSKEELARVLMASESDRFLSFLESALRRFDTWDRFVDFWVFVLRRSISDEFSRGCPFLRYAQTRPETTTFERELKLVFERAEAILCDYFVLTGEVGEAKAAVIAKQTLAIYEGTTQLAVLTGDLLYLDALKGALKKVATT